MSVTWRDWSDGGEGGLLIMRSDLSEQAKNYWTQVADDHEGKTVREVATSIGRKYQAVYNAYHRYGFKVVRTRRPQRRAFPKIKEIETETVCVVEDRDMQTKLRALRAQAGGK